MSLKANNTDFTVTTSNAPKTSPWTSQSGDSVKLVRYGKVVNVTGTFHMISYNGGPAPRWAVLYNNLPKPEEVLFYSIVDNNMTLQISVSGDLQTTYEMPAGTYCKFSFCYISKD